MSEVTDSSQVALETMRQWSWLRCDPDGNEFPPSMELGEAVSRLAMTGLLLPQRAVLALLCKGDLIANGRYKWRKYHWGSFFQHEEHYAELDKRQWQTLSDLIEEERKELAGHGVPFFGVDLEKLKMENCPVYAWSFSQSQFSTALCPPDTTLRDRSYFEEWFTAWDIDVRPHLIPDFESAPERANTKTGRPLSYDWLEATNAIWAKLYGNELKPKSQADVERALIQHLRNGDEEPGQSTVRPFAKRIWEKFQET